MADAMLQLSSLFVATLILTLDGSTAETKYQCPAGWDYGSSCGNHNCYRVVSVPPEKRPRVIDDNFCLHSDKNAMPAIIRCEEENSLLIPKFPNYHDIINRTGLGIGFYIPENIPFGPNNFVNRDGSKVEYTKWGWEYFVVGGIREPGTTNKKAVIVLTHKTPKGNLEYTWHDVGLENIYNLLCKMPATAFEIDTDTPKHVPPTSLTLDGVNAETKYQCPAGWDYGPSCGNHNCYRVVSVPPEKRPRVIDDNFCLHSNKDAMPAIIRCEEENSLLIPKFPSYHDIINKTGLGIGFYIPENIPFGPNNFVNRDGSKVEYTKWGWEYFVVGGIREPGTTNKKAVIILTHKTTKGNFEYTWHDVGLENIYNLLCKMPATAVKMVMDIPKDDHVPPVLIPAPTTKPQSSRCHV